MKYEVKFSTQATKFFKSLSLDVQERVKDKFREFQKILQDI